MAGNRSKLSGANRGNGVCSSGCWFGALLALTLLAGNAEAAIFMRLDGVPGGSLDADHEGWIEVERIQHSLAPPLVGIEGPAANGLMAITKSLDKSSPKLAQATASGTTFPVMEVEFTRTEGGSQVFFHIRLQNVFVYFFRAEGRTDEVSSEIVAFFFEGLEWTYVEADTSGRPLVNHKMYWDYLRGEGGVETDKVGFVVQATQTAGEGLQLEWEAEEGRTYRLMRATDLGQGFEPVQDVLAETGGKRTLQLPATGSFGFYYLTELPE